MDENTWLAVEVMGWEEHPRIKGQIVERDSHGYISRYIDWTPLKNIEQAFMLLNTMAVWQIDNDGLATYTVTINSEFSAQNSEMLDAIVEAVLQASGWEG